MRCAAAAAAGARVLAVGPARALRSIGEAARAARDGDIVEVDAGEYAGDVAVWTQDRLTIRAVGGRAVLRADGRSAEGKAIWVVRAGAVRAEGFDFSGARVAHRNGAGIRFERGRLALFDCSFTDNENGILTAGDPAAELEIASCEFGHNGFGDGYSHNLYAGAIGRLAVTGSYFHHARAGHLLKSRAAENRIVCNRLTDEEGGRASYELEFPNGGVALVAGNLIAQGAATENPIVISYGAEGYLERQNRLVLVHNTLVDARAEGGVFLAVRAGQRSVTAVNNLLVGAATLGGSGEFRNNLAAQPADFVDAGAWDYRLRAASALAGRVTAPGAGVAWHACEYVHPRGLRAAAAASAQPGAAQTTGPAGQ